MYKLLLTFRYLRRKLIALFAVLAVTLCTAMVIIVISIMGGFLHMLKTAGHTLMGDVAIFSGLGGFPHYQELIDELEELPAVEAATPIIKTYGLLKLPYGIIQPVQVIGARGRELAQVTSYRSTLFWTRERLDKYPRVARVYDEKSPLKAGLEMENPWGDTPAMVMGIEVSPYNLRNSKGEYVFAPSVIGSEVVLTIIPMTPQGGILKLNVLPTPFVIVNEFHSGLYQVDSRRVFIPFDKAQKLTAMDAAKKIKRTPGGAPVIRNGQLVIQGTIPARATEVWVSGVEGVDELELRKLVVQVYQRVAKNYEGLPPLSIISIQTWQQRQAQFINAVENEKGLLTVLFGIISLVAVVMITVVFYMIVLEKTREVGVLRSLGAPRSGVASIFLTYGGAVGVVGAACGLVVAYLIVTYINQIHAWFGNGFGAALFVLLTTLAGAALALGGVGAMALARRLWRKGGGERSKRKGSFWGVRGVGGKTLSVAVLGLIGGLAALWLSNDLADTLNERWGFVIWDRSVYFFDVIPHRVDWTEVGVICGVAVFSAVVGASIPAIKAARVDPVRSLRYE